MSTDWIKMRVDLRTHPKVVVMAAALKADKLRVIGGLFAVWAIFDAHSTDGVLDGYTFRMMDGELGWKGFSNAMSVIGWLDELPGGGLEAPRFDEHNGQSAKRRAQETARKAAARAETGDDRTKAERMSDWVDVQNGNLSAPNADTKRAREEKRREEEENTPDPQSGFAEFWTAWPKSSRKGGKAECEKLWRSQRLEFVKTSVVAHVRLMAASDDWRKEDGRYIPAPIVYLRGKRWDGADDGGQQGGLDLPGAL